MDQGAQGCGANNIQAAANTATLRAKYRSNQRDLADQNNATPTPCGAEDPIRSSAKPYQNAIASAVQTIAERKNSLGRGKNETNMLGIHARVRDLVSTLGFEICGLLYRTPAVRRRAEIPVGGNNPDHHRPIEANRLRASSKSTLGNSRGPLEMHLNDVGKQSALSEPAPPPACAPRSPSPAPVTPRPAGMAPPVASRAPEG